MNELHYTSVKKKKKKKQSSLFGCDLNSLNMGIMCSAWFTVIVYGYTGCVCVTLAGATSSKFLTYIYTVR